MNRLLNSYKYRDALRESICESTACAASRDMNLRDAPESTCRFGTRIDWILLPPTLTATNSGIKLTVIPGGYNVISSDLSDHQLIVANIEIELC